ncbi:MAG: nicotinate mononucleotide-dependent phosphoribosyltransferase CobT [Thermoplasmata archaeon]
MLDMIFILTIGNTAISRINGITAAGGNPDLIKFTPPADAEYLFFERPRCINSIPVTPSGNPTPAIITKASRELAKFPVMVVRSGSTAEPLLPYVFVSSKEGGDIRREAGVPGISEIIGRSKILADELFSLEKEAMLAESIPGGTTTAMAILRRLGYDSISSSSLPMNPVDLKSRVVDEAMRRAGDVKGLNVLKELGDPVLAFIFAFSREFRGKIYLAGGTQMLAVAALLKLDGVTPEGIVTTRYVVGDKTATFSRTAREIGVDFIEVPLDLSVSKYQGLREYEKGVVKEGVGAGGAYYIASKAGFTNKEIVNRVDTLYHKLTGE